MHAVTAKKNMPAGARILVAEDNPVNLHIAIRMLEKLGYAPDAVVDGLEAFNRHCKSAYDLLLMDCEMPGLDGYEATQRIRALEGAARRTPIIALSASIDDCERERCLKAGMDTFLPKPLRPQVLAETLACWLPQSASNKVSAFEYSCTDELASVQRMFGNHFAALSTLYHADSPARIAALHRACREGDATQLAKLAHALSGSSMSIGATGLSALCKEVELRAKTGSLADIAARLALIETEYLRISAKLQELLNGK
ncbi:MAG TPA: response regulator [Noviherbaspirillum sp.]|nr:response regulator [Noviherbaspirillum sp.]